MKNLETLKSLIPKVETREGVPKGAFCRADLENQGMAQSQASGLIKDLRIAGKIKYLGKYKTRKYTGDWNQTPFYEVSK